VGHRRFPSVEKAGGVRQVSGQARVEIERAVKKARTLVVKHPGQHDQSVHGGKGKGGGKAPTSAPASAGGGGGGASPEVEAITGTPEFKAKAKALDSAVKTHRIALQEANMPPSLKKECDMYLKQVQSSRKKMKTAQSARELSELKADAGNAGEIYKGLVRRHGFNVGRDNVLGGSLKDWDIQELADGLPIPFVD
jgi:hypothetical protein